MTGRKWIHTVILLAASALCTTSLCAAQITTRLGRDRVYTGDTVLLEVYVEDARSVKPDTLPQLDNVEAGFAGTMRSLEIVNGRRTTYLVLRYTLRSDMPGTYTVPPFPILVDGSRMMTGEVTFTVVEGTSRRRSRNDPFGMFERLLDPEVPEEKPVEFTGVRKLSKDICYAGETVIVRYYVIGPADEDFVAERVWNTGKNGIISKEIDEHLPEQTLPEDGTGTIRKHVATLAVTPVMSGNFVLKDEIATVVHEMSTGLFSHRVRRRVRFHAASLDVLPLPEEGRPEDFSGNIGSYRIYLEPPETETVTQYDTVNITVVVAGRGPMDNINPPVYPETDGDTSIFLSDTEKKISIKNASYQGEIRYTYSIIPSETGEQSVGPFSLDFFDPYEGVYRTESTERVHLSVQEAPGEVETQPVSEKENTFPLAIILFGAAAAAVLVVVSVLQYRSETQRREAFRASVIPTGRRKGKRKTSEAVSGGRGKDEPSSATIPADITADDVAGYYRYALKTAASGDDVRGLYRELKRAIDFILKEKPPSQSGREYLEGARTYLERTAYGGAQGDVRILRDIAQKTLTYLEPAP